MIAWQGTVLRTMALAIRTAGCATFPSGRKSVLIWRLEEKYTNKLQGGPIRTNAPSTSLHAQYADNRTQYLLTPQKITKNTKLVANQSLWYFLIFYCMLFYFDAVGNWANMSNRPKHQEDQFHEAAFRQNVLTVVVLEIIRAGTVASPTPHLPQVILVGSDMFNLFLHSLAHFGHLGEIFGAKNWYADRLSHAHFNKAKKRRSRFPREHIQQVYVLRSWNWNGHHGHNSQEKLQCIFAENLHTQNTSH